MSYLHIKFFALLRDSIIRTHLLIILQWNFVVGLLAGIYYGYTFHYIDKF